MQRQDASRRASETALEPASPARDGEAAGGGSLHRQLDTLDRVIRLSLGPGTRRQGLLQRVATLRALVDLAEAEGTRKDAGA